LDQLHHFAKRHNQEAVYSLSIASHAEVWYSWAIVGINISNFIVNLLRERKLQWYQNAYCFIVHNLIH
jgi:hypothetical protein